MYVVKWNWFSSDLRDVRFFVMTCWIIEYNAYHGHHEGIKNTANHATCFIENYNLKCKRLFLECLAKETYFAFSVTYQNSEYFCINCTNADTGTKP
jgi:hypothetical protein